jgi:predicted DNA binding CopG/RHH family protein
VLRGAVSRETALQISIKPGDLDLMLRKFLYAHDAQAAGEGEPMAEPLSDFSKILELQEIKKLYDELQERQGQDVRERDEEISRLRSELSRIEESGPAHELEHMRVENDRLAKQLQVLRQEYEAKIERLNARLRELSAGAVTPTMAPGSEGERKGFFRR